MKVASPSKIEMSKRKVIIFDRADYQRLERHRLAFVSAQCDVVNFDGESEVAIQEADVLMIHYGDDQPDVINVTRKVTVYFGGGAARDTRWDIRQDTRPEVYRMWRTISSDGNGALSDAEAIELIAYAAEVNSDVPRPVPEFLNPLRNFSSLIALSILCQGFLAVHAPDMLGAKSRTPRSMESTTFKDAVGDRRWWLEGLYGRTLGNDKAIDMPVSRDGPMASLGKDWEWPEKNLDRATVQKLLDSIQTTSKPAPTVVYEAHVAICNFLSTQAA